ncbi:MAG: T9SS type A sorting domain-containing protein [Bacteroidales bacterium]|nr:T9SS type A sorting domain-containing protein [Bacteroidales bacterium]
MNTLLRKNCTKELLFLNKLFESNPSVLKEFTKSKCVGKYGRFLFMSYYLDWARIKKAFYTFILFIYSSTLCGQNFSFNNVVIPDLGEFRYFGEGILCNNKTIIKSVGEVDKSWITATFYNDGNDWVQVDQSQLLPIGRISGIPINSNSIYAMHLTDNGLFEWNDNNISWSKVCNKPSDLSTFAIKPFVYEQNKAFFKALSHDEDYGELWHFDGNSFVKKTSNYHYSFTDLYVIDETNVLITTYRWGTFPGKLFKYDGVNLIELFSFPIYTYNTYNYGGALSIWTNDENIFYFATDDEIYKWDNTIQQMVGVFEIPDSLVHFGSGFVAIDDQNIFNWGYYGLYHINMTTNIITNFYPSSGQNFYDGSKALYENNKILWLCNYKILEMTIMNSIDSETFEQLSVYPNPAKEKVTVEFPVLGITDKTIEIIDINGKVVQKANFSEFKLEMDISSLCNGMYFLRLYCPEGLIVKKFIKNV